MKEHNLEFKEQIAQLEQELSEALEAEQLVNSRSWDVLRRIMQQEINRAINDMCSEKFVSDHEGYLAARATVVAYRRLLRRIEAKVASAPKVQEKLDAFKS